MFSSRHFLIVIGGIQRAGTVDQDVWQFGMRLPVTGFLNVPDADYTTILNDAYTDANTWWSAVRAQFHPSVAFTHVKANLVGTDGRYINQEKTYRKDAAAPINGLASGATLPADVAVAVTLNTAAARGHASKGRVYLPAPSATTLADGRLSQTASDALGNATAALVKNLGNVPGLDETAVGGYGDISVMSRIGAGTTRTVTGIRIGDLYDTQQRRSNKMREVYRAYNLPA